MRIVPRRAASGLCFAFWLSLIGVCRGTDQAGWQECRHPDGVVGRISLHASADYTSVSNKSGRFVPDIETSSLRLDLVAGPRITFETAYSLFKQDSTKHSLQAGVKFYWKDPLRLEAPCNPDGRIGGVVLHLTGGASFSGSPHRATSGLFDVGATLPVSKHASLAVGYRYCEKPVASDVAPARADITIYFSEYTADSAYVNPNGPVGYPVVKLSGGGSSRGVLLGLSVIFPIQQEISLTSAFAAKRITSPHQSALTAGVGISVYPRK